MTLLDDTHKSPCVLATYRGDANRRSVGNKILSDHDVQERPTTIKPKPDRN
jgi:hypothetical protein